MTDKARGLVIPVRLKRPERVLVHRMIPYPDADPDGESLRMEELVLIANNRALARSGIAGNAASRLKALLAAAMHTFDG